MFNQSKTNWYWICKRRRQRQQSDEQGSKSKVGGETKQCLQFSHFEKELDLLPASDAHQDANSHLLLFLLTLISLTAYTWRSQYGWRQPQWDLTHQARHPLRLHISSIECHKLMEELCDRLITTFPATMRWGAYKRQPVADYLHRLKEHCAGWDRGHRSLIQDHAILAEHICQMYKNTRCTME